MSRFRKYVDSASASASIFSVGIFRYVGHSSIIFFAASIHRGNPPSRKEWAEKPSKKRQTSLSLKQRGGGRSYTRADEAKIPDFNTVALHFRESAVKQMSWIYFFIEFWWWHSFLLLNHAGWFMWRFMLKNSHKTDFRVTFKRLLFLLSVGPHVWIFESGGFFFIVPFP